MPNCPLTLRLVKGSKLTFAELDQNFISLRNCVNDVESYVNDNFLSLSGGSLTGPLSACTGGIYTDELYSCSNMLTVWSDVTIEGNVVINGSATTINTEVIKSKDNNIVLNYSGTTATANGGGISVLEAQGAGIPSSLYVDENGCWHADPGFCDLTVDGVAFTAQTPYLFVDDGSINSITTRYAGNNITDSDYSNIGGGKDNTIDPGSDYSNIAGGLNNLIDDYTKYSVIGGGNYNRILGGEGYFNSNAIVGGGGNTIDTSYYSFIGGGTGNTMDFGVSYSVIVGGTRNRLEDNKHSFIGAGDYTGAGSGSDKSFFGTGYYNFSSGPYTTIVNGRNNLIIVDSGLYGYGEHNAIIGGAYNEIRYGSIRRRSNNTLVPVGSEFNIINGGGFNEIKGIYNTIINGGGYRNGFYIVGNFITGNTSFIGTGVGNKVSGNYSTILNGGKLSLFGSNPNGNTIKGHIATIIGGINNTIESTTYTNTIANSGNILSTIGGGGNNLIYGSMAYTFIGGGSFNELRNSQGASIVGGTQNILGSTYTTSKYSVIGGGKDNKLYGNYSVITGGKNNKFYTKYGTIVGGKDNTLYGEYSVITGGFDNSMYLGYRSSIVGGSGNYIYDSSYGSILGGYNNYINNQNSVFIIGSNITSISANTTHVERLNIGTVNTGSTSTEVFVRETNGMVNTTPFSIVSGGLNGKYVELITGYTANVTQTITHNLGTGDEVVVDVIDTTNNERIGSVIDNYQTNALDLTLSQNYASIKIVIIG